MGFSASKKYGGHEGCGKGAGWLPLNLVGYFQMGYGVVRSGHCAQEPPFQFSDLSQGNASAPGKTDMGDI